jgi:dTDP-glucose 4,6-dehydratase
MKWVDKKVNVTGASGFIGSHLVEKLVDLGAEVSCFLRYNSRNSLGNLAYLSKDKLDSIKIVRGDLKNNEIMHHFLKGSEVVMHLGAMISIPYSYENPQEVIATNVIGTMNVLNAARYSDIERIIITSTSEVYGTAQYVPIDEKHPLNGRSPYAASKIGADMIALSYHLSYDLPVSIIRPFNTYGPRQSARAVIPTIIAQAITDDVIRLGDVSTTRDFTFVGDTVDGFIKIAESDASVGEVINIGSGDEITIKNIVTIVGKILGKDLNIVEDRKRKRPPKSEVMMLIASNSRARELIGWRPKYAFEVGLKETVSWIRENIDIFRPENYEI